MMPEWIRDLTALLLSGGAIGMLVRERRLGKRDRYEAQGKLIEVLSERIETLESRQLSQEEALRKALVENGELRGELASLRNERDHLRRVVGQQPPAAAA